MRYLVGFVLAVALGVVPLGAGAQDGEVTLALQLEADEDVGLTSTLGEAADVAALERADLKVKRARIGLISTAAAMLAGGVFVAVAASTSDCWSWYGAPEWCGGVAGTGLVLIIGGAAGTITTGAMLGVRKRKRRVLQRAHSGAEPRVNWSFAGARLTF